MTPRTIDQSEAAAEQRVHELDLELDAEAMATVGNLFRAANAIRVHAEERLLTRRNIAWTDWVVLWVVWLWGEMETREVAAEAGIAKTTLSGVVERLVQAGWMDRRTHPHDGRRRLVRLTARGHTLMSELVPRINELEVEATAALSASQSRNLSSYLRAVTRRIGV